MTDTTFAEVVLAAKRPIVVDFWAPWCAPCTPVTALLARLAEEHAGRVDVVTLDVDENPLVAARYGVLTLPTAILFEGGEARSEVLGAHSREHYERAWAAWLTDT